MPLLPEQHIPFSDIFAGKHAEREQLLLERPDLHLTINIDRLTAIAPLIDFVCLSRCSIARNQAVRKSDVSRASDIDQGIVLTEKSLDEATQIQFIEEIRRQGFTAHHPVELDELVRTNGQSDLTLDQRMTLVGKRVQVEGSLIHFYDLDFAVGMYRVNPFNDQVRTMMRGYSILRAGFPTYISELILDRIGSR